MKTAELGRLAGALLLRVDEAFYLIGNLKEPCDFRAAGFVTPAEEIDACAHPWIRLEALEGARVPGAVLRLDTSMAGAALAELVAKRLLIVRNGSVSDRLWRLITGADASGVTSAGAHGDNGSWLVQIPAPIWDIVRDTVLRCS